MFDQAARRTDVEDLIQQIQTYRRNYAITARAHYLTAARMKQRHLIFGVPAVVISAVAGTAIFATLQEDPDKLWRLLTGGVLLVAAVLTALQTFFRFSEEAEKSVVAARRNSDLRRRLEHLKLKYVEAPPDQRNACLMELESYLNAFTEVAEQSPTIPPDLHERAAQEFDAGDGSS